MIDYSNKKTTNKVVLSALDIMKGWTGTSPSWNQMYNAQPYQCIPLEDKGPMWKEWCANWYEGCALKELPDKRRMLQKNYNLAVGVINRSDYDPNKADSSSYLRAADIQENDQDILNQFFPIIPNIIQVFLGEFVKRDRAVTVEATDPDTKTEKLTYKTQLVQQILMQKAMQDRQSTLMQMGIVPQGDTQQQYQQEMQAAQQLAEAQNKYNDYRTIAEKWSEKFVNLFGTRNSVSEIEIEAFLDALAADEAIFCLNLRENSFVPERLRPRETYVNISPGKKWYSEANFVVNTKLMSIPDIINTFRNDLTTDQVERLELEYTNFLQGDAGTRNMITGKPVYDITQSVDWNNSLSPDMREKLSSQKVQDWILGALKAGHEWEEEKYTSMFRVSRIWWTTQRKIGLLTKIDGISPEPIIETIDENFRVTDKPQYDNSLLKESTTKNLIKGEHIDWKYVNEWRYIVKIGQNVPYGGIGVTATPGYTANGQFANIYLYGDPIKFQFKNSNEQYGARPPLEGCRFSPGDTKSVSLVERTKPWQIVYNILNNKALKLLSQDKGPKLMMGASSLKTNSIGQEDGIDPAMEMDDALDNSTFIVLDDSREAAQNSSGRLLEPRLVNISTVQEVGQYYQIAAFCKQQAYESVGVSPQRLSEIGKSESATGIQQAVEGSVNQTEMYFDTFCVQLMPRVWNMIIEAGQYYTCTSPEFADNYLTSEAERDFFAVNRMYLLMKDLFVMAKNTADIRKLMSDLKQLSIQDNTMGATFLDKMEVYLSKSPTEALEKLRMARDREQQQQQSQFQQQQQLQQQQEQARTEQQQREQQFLDKLNQDKLAEQKYEADLKANTSVSTMPQTDALGQNAIQMSKVNQQADAANQMNQFNQQTLAFKQQQEQNANDLKREELAVRREDSQNRLQTAIVNKNSSDLKFAQNFRKKQNAK